MQILGQVLLEAHRVAHLIKDHPTNQSEVVLKEGWPRLVKSSLTINYVSVQFSSLTKGQEGQFSRDPHPVFSAGGHREQSWHGRDVHSLMLSIQHFFY